MAVDTPSTIAVLGAGPIGLEAALYARFLGYDVRVFDRGRVAENVRRWGHVKMFTPMSMNTSSLGRAALFAQDNSPPNLVHDQCPTGVEWVERYLVPISQTDLLIDFVFPHTEVVSVTRADLWKGQKLGDPQRDETMFRILVRDREGLERAEDADVVIDTTGVYGNPNWLGPGGGPAIGECALRNRIDYGIPDVLGEHRDRFRSRRTLIIGSGYSAATTAVSIERLANEFPTTTALWLTQPCHGGSNEAPLRRIENDRLPERDSLARHASAIARGQARSIQHRSGWLVMVIQENGDRLEVRLRNVETDEEITESVDHIVANVGYHVDSSLFRELHVHQCYATEGPMRLAASLLNENCRSADCLDQRSRGPDVLRTPEPNFYILGSKSYGRLSNFLYGVGLEQIRDLFVLIGDRENLDLYAGAKNLPQ